MMLSWIPRIERPSLDEFEARYLLRRTPVVIRGLYGGEAISGTFRVPELARAFDRLDDVLSHSFSARAGSFAHLQFDADHRNALQTHVSGRKRVFLFHPSAARHLLPLCNVAGVCLQHLNDDERECLLRRTGGMQAVLQPGETLFIPALYWHYADYLDPGTSFDVRFGRNRYNRFFATNFMPDYRVQALSALLSGPEHPLAEEIVGPIVDAFSKDGLTRSGRYRAVRDITRKLWERYTPDGIGEPPYRFDLTLQEDQMFESSWQSGDLYERLTAPRA
ncbi:cupin-like domain-containing protein [Pendulispora rubella]|uniref:Cupin-like domain-containing protein n=1 Tax=Pendulispora rubella TaxID=2741070 RepID=A0ABZ2LFM9_9BACT